jgi:diguanylate cyclase (GGDEF)-like protein
MARLANDRGAVSTALALLCVAGGVVGSLLGARAVARSDTGERRTAFEHASSAVASSLRLAIQRGNDLRVSAGTYFASNPDSSSAEFKRWARWAQVGSSRPELDRLALVALLPAAAPSPAAGLRAPAPGAATPAPSAGSRAAAAGAAPPAGSTVSRGAHAVSVDGRAYLCSTVGELGSGAGGGSSRRDCALTPALLATRVSGQSRYRSASVAGGRALRIDTPVYRGSAAPLTAVGRRAAFVGWLREVLLAQKMLQGALLGAPGEGARLRYRVGSFTALFASGAAQAGAQSTTASLHGGWSVRILGPSVDAGVLSNGDSLALLALGCLASVLAGALVFVLGAARPALAPAPTAPACDSESDLYDPLTGLPNRALTLDRAGLMLARVGRQSGMLTGALLVDVDWFKDINDKLGRAAGDQLLRVVAERLQRVARADDTIGRLGEDRFVALVESQARGVRLDSLAGRMIEALHEPVELEGFGPSFHMTASIGVAFGRYVRIEDLLGDTEVALEAAKAAGKNRFTLFNANLRSVIEDRGVLDSELNAALQDKQFFLLYQPIYDLNSRRVVGMEAQIRWRHPERGTVSPADFIPAAEETGLIVPIGRWALEEACTRAAAWRAGGEQVGVLAKVSAVQLDRDGFVSDVRRALQQSGIEASALTLEVAEAAVIADIAAAGKRLEEVRQLGVRIAVEDFGNGYAYRSDLQRLPLDLLKIDRSAVAASDDEDYRSWLVEAIVLFARDLSLKVVATKVETAEQLAGLERIGCTMAQGPLLGMPTPADGIDGVLREELAVAPAGAVGSGAGAAAADGVDGQASAGVLAPPSGEGADQAPAGALGQPPAGGV